MATHAFAAGQQWRFHTPPGYEAARLIIGAILHFEDRDSVACVSITAAPQRQADGTVAAAPITLLPLTLGALAETVTTPDGEGTPPPEFADVLTRWSADERGLGYFTVPFDGHLDRMIARQMSALAG